MTQGANPIVDNKRNGDYQVRSTDLGATLGVLQHMRLDIGVGAAESLVTPANPLPVTLTGAAGDINISKYGGTATTLGQKTAASSIPVVLASNVKVDSVLYAFDVDILSNQQLNSFGGALFVTDTSTATDSAYPIFPTSVSRIGGLVDDASPTTVGENGTGAARITPKRAWHNNLRDNSGTEIASATTTPGASDLGLVVRNIPSGIQAVSGTVAVTGVATETTLAALNAKVASCDTDAVTISTLPGIAGTIAHDAVDSGNPVKIGIKAATANPTAVAAGDRANVLGGKRGELITQGSLQETRFRGRNASRITNTTSTSIVAAGGAGVVRVITAITVSNTHATVSTDVDILDGATVVWSGPAAAVSGGYTIPFPDGLVCTANTAINAQCETTGASVRVCVAGHNTN